MNDNTTIGGLREAIWIQLTGATLDRLAVQHLLDAVGGEFNLDTTIGIGGPERVCLVACRVPLVDRLRAIQTDHALPTMDATVNWLLDEREKSADLAPAEPETLDLMDQLKRALGGKGQAPRAIAADGYPVGWPRCAAGCGRPRLDGHATCGSVGCYEAGHR